MFKGRIISRSNINGKLHTFQKDFDDYESYQDFLSRHPEYNEPAYLGNFWNPFQSWEEESFSPLSQNRKTRPPVDSRFLPDGIDLNKYEQRKEERRQSEIQRNEKRSALESGKIYLTEYLKENPNDPDAQEDLKKIEEELKNYKNTPAS